MRERKTTPNRGPKVENPPLNVDAILDFTRAPEPEKPKGLDIALWDEVALLSLRAEIDAMLPPAKLKDLDLEAELVRQYRVVKSLQNDIITDMDTPPNQKAQVANSCAATLVQLTKMQSEFYTSERFKAIEGIMIKCLKTLPEEAVLAFFADYEGMSP